MGGNKYNKLVKNTLLFGIASFSSKFLSLFILMVLTRVFTQEQVGAGQLVVTACNVIVPIISLCVHEAVIRYGLDKHERKSDIFTTAIMTILAGYAFLLLCLPVIRMITVVSGYVLHVYIYVLTSALRSTVTHFVRASGFSRIFAIDGIITTVTTVTFTVSFILGLGQGVGGYIWAIIAADGLSAIGLILVLRLYRFFKPLRFSKNTLREMLRYSMPLVPTAVFWWVTNLSSQFIMEHFIDKAAIGLYTTASKLPSMITLVSAVFTQAWQISAFSEYDSRKRVRFYSTVFTAYHTLVFIAASGLILLLKPLYANMWGADFVEAWIYSPFLILATAFSCLVTFLGTIYNAAKSNNMVTITTFVGAAVSIALNFYLIPKYGPGGAAFATFFCYLVVFLIRAVDTRRYVPLKIRPMRIALSLVLLLAQTWACLAQPPYGIAMQIAALLLLVLFNLGPVLYIAENLLQRFRRRRRA